MKQSINKCISECSHPEATSFIPSRLLYIEPEPYSECARLVVTSKLVGHLAVDIKSVKYAALSYCWGPPGDARSQLRTEKNSVDARKAGIHEDLMPPVLRDAIQVCRSLSIQYLWVDSLCIIQDDTLDWERESTLMSLVYGNAFVTICAVSSSSCQESFFSRDRRHVLVPFTSQVNSSIVGHYNVVCIRYLSRLGSLWLASFGRRPFNLE